MCGIIGFWSRNPINKEKVIDAVIKGYEQQKNRGMDSFGIFFLNSEDGKAYVKKTMTEQKIPELVKFGANLIIFHHRLASIGSKTIKNQHPFIVERKHLKIVGVHNGTWKGSEKYREKYNLNGSTDSEVIFNLIADGIDNLRRISGGSASLVWYEKYSRSLNFWRTGKPMILGYNSQEDLLFFASTRKAIFSMAEVLLGKKHFEIFNRVYTSSTVEYMYYRWERDSTNRLHLCESIFIIPKSKGKKPLRSIYSCSYIYSDYDYYQYSLCSDNCSSDYHTQSPCFECEEIYGCGSDCSTCPFRGGCEMERQRKKYGCSLCEVGEQSLV